MTDKCQTCGSNATIDNGYACAQCGCDREDLSPSDAAACSASAFMDASFKIGSQYEALNHRVDQMMFKRGWIHTSSTPGSIWMWQKIMPDGRVILTDCGTARMLEEAMSHEESLQNAKDMGRATDSDTI